MKDVVAEIRQILREFHIQNEKDYFNKLGEELSEIYENVKIVQEEYDLFDEEMEKVLESIFEE